LASVDTQRLRIALSPPQAVTTTDAIMWLPTPDTDRPALALAHGAGSDLTDPVLRAAGRGLADRGVPVMAFAFGYAAARRRRPDPMPRLQAAYRDVVAEARRRFDRRPLVLGGRSLGARVASHLAAEGQPVAGLCLLGYPLHPAGRTDRLRTDHWEHLAVPTLMVSGDRDGLCDLTLLDREIARMPQPPRVHVVEGADHAFAVRRRDARDAAEVLREVVTVVDEWLRSLAPQPHRAGEVPA
jgi:predicted alpha/beta-hydrolase family hydrolase